MNKGKRRAVAVRPRILHDDAYRAQVLAAAGAESAREVETERQYLAATAEGRSS